MSERISLRRIDTTPGGIGVYERVVSEDLQPSRERGTMTARDFAAFASGLFVGVLLALAMFGIAAWVMSG